MMNEGLARRWRVAALTSIGALIVLVFAWQLSNPSIATGLLATVLSLPLVAPLVGLWQGRRHTYRWATLCVMPYFVVGVTEAVANPAARPWAAGMLVLALAWFVALVAYLRVAPRHEKLERNSADA